MRILVIDDDVELTELLREFLAARGFEVASRHDGPLGLEAALTGSAIWSFWMSCFPAWTGSKCFAGCAPPRVFRS